MLVLRVAIMAIMLSIRLLNVVTSCSQSHQQILSIRDKQSILLSQNMTNKERKFNTIDTKKNVTANNILITFSKVSSSQLFKNFIQEFF
jgi:hypothetical protein